MCLTYTYVDFVNHWCYKWSITTLTGVESLNIIRCLSLHKSFFILKIIAVVLVIAVLTVSCASGPGPKRQSGNLWCDRERLWMPKWRYAHLSTIDGKSPNDFYVKGAPGTHIGYQIPCGLNTVETNVLWSNQYMDYIELPLDVKEGRSYVVFAYELEQGQDPNAATPCIEPPTNVAPPTAGKASSSEQSFSGLLFGKDGKSWGQIIATRSGDESVGEVIAKETAGFMVDIIGITAGYFFAPFALSEYFIKEISKAQKARKAAAASQDNTANTETQPIDNTTDTIAQPPDSTLDSATKPEDTTITVDQSTEQPPAPTARPFDGFCYVWVEDFESREVVAGTRPSGAGK
jgi:hypothetical protein